MDGKCRKITVLCMHVDDEIMASKFVICVGSRQHKLLRCICAEDKPSNALLVASQHSISHTVPLAVITITRDVMPFC